MILVQKTNTFLEINVYHVMILVKLVTEEIQIIAFFVNQGNILIKNLHQNIVKIVIHQINII